MSRKIKSNTTDTLFYEKKAADLGFSRIAGIDEAGRGPLAGPVVASCVIIKELDFQERIDDSKKLSEKRREKAFLEIIRLCDVGIGLATVEEIDRLNIFNATLLAMKRSVEELAQAPDYLLVDGRMDLDLPQKKNCLVGGDSLSLSISCASIIAKVFRDRLMLEEDKKYPEYGFIRHKGYGTKEHMDAIASCGLSPIHRRTFGPFGNKSKKGSR